MYAYGCIIATSDEYTPPINKVPGPRQLINVKNKYQER